MPFRLRLPAALLALAALAAPLGATTVVPMDTRALVSRSNDIVIGEVLAVRSRWNEDRSRIVTDVTLRVDQTLKGGASGELTLTQIGGEVDGLRYTVEGAPRFSAGEQALLFAWRDRAGRPQVSGLAQGKFDIRRDPATGARWLSRPLPGLAREPLRLGARRSGVPEGTALLDDTMRELQRVIAEDAGR